MNSYTGYCGLCMHGFSKSLWDNKIIANLLLSLCNINLSYQISDVDELKRRIISDLEYAALSHTAVLLRDWPQRLRAYVHAGGGVADILSTRWNKDCVMWHVGLRRWLFWETITVSHVCCYSVNRSNGDKCTINDCVYGSILHFKFPRVVQAHTLGEVGILGTILLRVYSGTILTIFIEIGSYLTDSKK